MTTTFPQVWELESLLPAPTTTAFQQHWNDYRERLAKLVSSSNSLPPIATAAVAQIAASATTESTQWDAFLTEMQAVETIGNDLRSYVECLCAAHAEDPHYQQLDASLTALSPQREQVNTNLELALRSLSEEQLAAWCNSSPLRQQVEYALTQKRRMGQLRLARDAEVLTAELAVDGFHGWSRLYDRMSGRLKITLHEAGQTVERSVSQVQLDSPERSVRQARYHATDAAWATIAEPCADAINHLAGWRLSLNRHLKVQDHLTAPLLLNRMRRETLSAMWQAVSARKAMLVEYLQLRAELMGLRELAWYDLPAPLPEIPGAGASADIPYDQACQLILEGFHRFSPELGNFAELALKNRWIEAENRSGKRQGGFCTSLLSAKESRIFMTYTNSADSMSTLAHELGHAYHSWVLKDQPCFLADYPMNLAETASTFAEAVLGESRIGMCESLYDQIGVLDGMLGDSVAFLMNIHARFLFEDRFYQQRAAGELTSGQLCELMAAAQREAYCNSLQADGYHERFWVSKLHFYFGSVPFYNFPYTFGYLLSLGVYQLGQQSGDQFPAQYRQFLIETGRADAEAAVERSFGYDLSQPDLWNLSLDVIADRVAQFRGLVRQWQQRLAAPGKSSS